MTLDIAPDSGLLPDGVDVSPAKRRLYEVAIDLFGRYTYHAVSTRDITNALGQQPSALYFHVSSKKDLLFELAVIGHRAHHNVLLDSLLGAGPEPRDQLRAVAAAHVRQHLDYPSLARVVNRELHALNSEQLAEVMAIRTQCEQVFIDVIERGVRLKVFTSTDSFLDGKAIGAMGVRTPEWWTPDSVRTKEEVINRYAEYALRIVI